MNNVSHIHLSCLAPQRDVTVGIADATTNDQTHAQNMAVANG
ncbi:MULTISPECIES: hypothetical protein [unclassified Mycobacterium]|nr:MULTISPECIES: hypothetical protein [unclassified Mycobacterium]